MSLHALLDRFASASDPAWLLGTELHAEEHAELLEAIELEASVEAGREHVARELADVVIVAYAAAYARGIDLDLAVEIVNAANLTKVGQGGVVRRADGKVVKPPGFVPPDLYRAC